MTSRSLPIPFPNVRRQHLEGVSVQIPSLRAVIAVFVALLILFGWLHLIMTLEIALTGREIQIKTEELEALVRHKSSLQQQISTLESPTVLAPAAYELGYADRAPLYVPLSGESANVHGNQQGDAWQVAGPASLESGSAPSGAALLHLSAENLAALFEAQATH